HAEGVVFDEQAGVVDQVVDPAVLVQQLRDQTAAEAGIADVPRVHADRRSPAGQSFLQCACGLMIAGVDGSHVCAFCTEQICDSSPDAPGAPGDDGDPIFHPCSSKSARTVCAPSMAALSSPATASKLNDRQPAST